MSINHLDLSSLSAILDSPKLNKRFIKKQRIDQLKLPCILHSNAEFIESIGQVKSNKSKHHINDSHFQMNQIVIPSTKSISVSNNRHKEKQSILQEYLNKSIIHHQSQILADDSFINSNTSQKPLENRLQFISQHQQKQSLKKEFRSFSFNSKQEQYNKDIKGLLKQLKSTKNSQQKPEEDQINQMQSKTDIIPFIKDNLLITEITSPILPQENHFESLHATQEILLPRYSIQEVERFEQRSNYWKQSSKKYISDTSDVNESSAKLTRNHSTCSPTQVIFPQNVSHINIPQSNFPNQFNVQPIIKIQNPNSVAKKKSEFNFKNIIKVMESSNIELESFDQPSDLLNKKIKNLSPISQEKKRESQQSPVLNLISSQYVQSPKLFRKGSLQPKIIRYLNDLNDEKQLQNLSIKQKIKLSKEARISFSEHLSQNNIDLKSIPNCLNPPSPIGNAELRQAKKCWKSYSLKPIIDNKQNRQLQIIPSNLLNLSPKQKSQVSPLQQQIKLNHQRTENTSFSTDHSSISQNLINNLHSLLNKQCTSEIDEFQSSREIIPKITRKHYSSLQKKYSLPKKRYSQVSYDKFLYLNQISD